MDMPSWVKQAHCAFKYTFKLFLSEQRVAEDLNHGRSKVGSYHLKTILFHALEVTELLPGMDPNPVYLLIELLQMLKSALRAGKLPHYFLPACDLLECVSEAEREHARSTVSAILAAPLKALLRLPCCPQGQTLEPDLSEIGTCLEEFLCDLEKTSLASGICQNEIRESLANVDVLRHHWYIGLKSRDGDISETQGQGRPELMQLEKLWQCGLNKIRVNNPCND